MTFEIIPRDQNQGYRSNIVNYKPSIECIEMKDSSEVDQIVRETAQNGSENNMMEINSNNTEQIKDQTRDNPFSQSSVLVAVRIRPFSKKELCNMIPSEAERYNYQLPSVEEQAHIKANMGTWGNAPIWKAVIPIDKNVLVFDPPNDDNDFGSAAIPSSSLLKQGSRGARNFRPNATQIASSNQKHKDIRFVFDQVYGEDSTQQEVYQGTAQSLIYSVMEGYNATVFAYGATGCGKTYTISGTNEDPGIIYLTMQELFKKMQEESQTKEIESTVSYLEVYNETIIDLLSNKQAKPNGLSLREDAALGVTVAGLSEHKPKNVDEVMNLVALGNQNRTMSPTEANAASSRSHAVLQIRIRQKSKNSGLNANMLTATLSIIDLAGSERATVTQNKGDRMREGANINRSLLALANCINALCDPKKGRHIPYRDSKLTRLLKFSLGGNCRTVMITCVSPSSTYYEETHNTLKYASRAKNIRTTLNKNTSSSKMHISQYTKKIQEQSLEIRRLQKEISDLKKSVGSSSSSVNKYNFQNNSRNNSINNSQQQNSLDNRRKIAAEQLVQDIRNRMSETISSACTSQYDWASASVFSSIFSNSQNTLKSWRDQFDSSISKTNSIDSNGSASEAYRKRIDELLGNLAQQGKKASRYADHSYQASQRFQYTAKKISTSTNPSQGLSNEQKQRIEQELKILQLTSEKKGLQRQIELLLSITEGYSEEIKSAFGLNAICLSNMKSVISELKEFKDLNSSNITDRPLRIDQIIEYLNGIYMASISGFSQSTSKIESIISLVLNSGGPSKIEAGKLFSLSSSPITKPYTINSKREQRQPLIIENFVPKTFSQLPPVPTMNSNKPSKSTQRKEIISAAINNLKSTRMISPRLKKSRNSLLGTLGKSNINTTDNLSLSNFMSPSKRKLETPIAGNAPIVKSSVTYTSAIRRNNYTSRRSSLSSNYKMDHSNEMESVRKKIKSDSSINKRNSIIGSRIPEANLTSSSNLLDQKSTTINGNGLLRARQNKRTSIDFSKLKLSNEPKSQSVKLISPNSSQAPSSRSESASRYNPLGSSAVPKKGILKNTNR
ncbi:Kinesin-like protein 5 [Smittium culicis]|uniref:Kinesin-like protein 5 n=1 Tax=Smittium culicis TaxID=133412 RepID=A0A1R1XSE5_9FUNG|nr:Kinesin-like protein 5 [Smittium culicis]OMJ17573.1 Kinesin-like protein 5 [Smittium culicis]